MTKRLTGNVKDLMKHWYLKVVTVEGYRLDSVEMKEISIGLSKTQINVGKLSSMRKKISPTEGTWL